MITITDTITGATATVETFDVAETVLGWNPDAPADVATAAQDLQDAIRASDHRQHELAEFLAIRIG